MDETEAYETGPVETVGHTLKAAREAQGKTIEDIASATRIPTRHLASLEESEWDKLPAPTYSIGFAKAYAGEVGLDRNLIGERLRDDLGGYRPPTTVASDYFAPSDPKRTIPVGMVLGAIAAIALLAFGLTWLLNRDINAPDNVPANAIAANELGPVIPVAPAPVVMVTADQTAWVDIRDGETVLKQGELIAGQSFQVPGDAIAPTLSTARPEALHVTLGTTRIPPLAPAGTKVDKLSLKPSALEQLAAAPPAASVPPTATPAPAPARPAPAPARRSAPKQAPTPAPSPSPPAAEPAPQPAGNSAG